VSRSKRNKTMLLCMFSDKLTLDEAEALKVANLDDWFLTTKMIPPAYFKKLNGNERRQLAKLRGKDAQAVKTLRTVKRTAVAAEEPVEIPDGKPAAKVATTNAPVDTIVPAKLPSLGKEHTSQLVWLRKIDKSDQKLILLVI
jgi:hypothetical protein